MDDVAEAVLGNVGDYEGSSVHVQEPLARSGQIVEVSHFVTVRQHEEHSLEGTARLSPEL